MGKLLLFELKKMLVKRRGIITIFLFIMAKIILSTALSENVDIPVEENKDIFISYEKAISGQPNAEKEGFLQIEYDSINNAPIELENLTYSLKYNDISSGEFAEKAAELDGLMAKKSGFNAVFNQYATIKNSPDKRYFLYANGWNALLTPNDFNPAALLILVVLIVPLFCYEYDSEIEGILVTTKRGREKLAFLKLAIGIVAAILVTVISSLTEAIACSIKYGLPHGGYPLQSLDFFSTSIWNVSLIKAFVILTLIKSFGSALLAVLMMMFSAITKKTISVLLLTSGIVLLPLFSPLSLSLKYRLPFPYSLMTAFGFIKGDEAIRGSIIFKHLSIAENSALFFVFTLMIFVFAYVMIRKYLGYKLINKSIKRVMPVLAALLLLTACNAKDPSPRNHINYNMLIDSRYGFYKDELYSVDSINGSMMLTRKNIANNEKKRVLLNPLLNSKATSIFSVYQDGNSLYCCYIYNEILYISKVNLDDFSETVLLSYTFQNSYDLLAFNKSKAFYQFSLLTASNIFVAENEVYFFYESSIYRINILTKKMAKLVDNCKNNIAFDGENIFYISNKLQIEALNIHNSSRRTISNIRTDYFYLFDGKIYFSNLNAIDEIGIYDLSVDKVTSTISVSAGYGFACDNYALYFPNEGDGSRLYKYDFSIGIAEKLGDERCYEILAYADSDRIFTHVESGDTWASKVYFK